MLTKLCLSVFLLSSSVFGLPVEDNGFVGLPRFPMDMGMNGEDRIYGGKEAAAGQFPHQISIVGVFGHRCSGSILNERFILTAAHCVDDVTDPQEYPVIVGSHKSNPHNGTEYKVQKFIVHEDYKLTQNRTHKFVLNDVALIQTAIPIQFNEFVRPIRLHPGFIGITKAVTSGWGGSNDRISSLKFLKVTTLKNDECRKIFYEDEPDFAPPVHDWDTICAYSGRKKHGVCHGDSGGPLTVDNKLIGITSWAYFCGGGLPDGYTRVSTYIDWINSNMRSSA